MKNTGSVREPARWLAGLPIVLAALIYLLVPVFEVRLLAMGLFVVMALRWMPARLVLTRDWQLLLLVLVFSLTYLFVPYWNGSMAILPRVVSAVVLWTAFAVIYLVYRRNAVDIAFKPRDRNLVWLFAVVFVLHAFNNYMAMKGSIAWMGDSDYHVSRTFYLLKYVLNRYSLFGLAGMVGSAVCYGFFKKRWLLWLCAGFAFAAGVLAALFYGDYIDWIRRYPVLFYYPNLALSVPLTAVVDRKLAYQEAFFRLLPFISALGIAVYAASRIKAGFAAKLTAALAIVSLPTMHYYSSITYIELPLILCVTAALLTGRRATATGSSSMVNRPLSWSSSCPPSSATTTTRAVWPPPCTS